MNSDASMAQLLRWRAAQAESEAPLPPTAARLLARARPWWEQWPERFAHALAQLGTMRVAYGHALTTPLHGRGGHPVAAVIVGEQADTEAAARVLYFSVRDDALRLRFQLDSLAGLAPMAYDVMLMDEAGRNVLLTAIATRAPDAEYRLDAPIDASLAGAWSALKVTDRMPFRLLLRPTADHD